MKIALFGLAAIAAIGFGTATASAQPILVPAPYGGPAYVAPAYPVYAPVPAIGATIVTPGVSVGIYPAGYRYGGYNNFYYGGYRGGYYPHHYHHGYGHGRW